MADYRTMFEYTTLRAWDLGGQDVTLTIERVEADEIEGRGGEVKRMPFVYFRGERKPLGINKTNGRTIAGMYGTDVTKWVGKRITLWPTTTEYEGKTVDCIRVRPLVPDDGAPELMGDLLAKDQPAARKKAVG